LRDVTFRESPFTFLGRDGKRKFTHAIDHDQHKQESKRKLRHWCKVVSLSQITSVWCIVVLYSRIFNTVSGMIRLLGNFGRPKKINIIFSEYADRGYYFCIYISITHYEGLIYSVILLFLFV